MDTEKKIMTVEELNEVIAKGAVGVVDEAVAKFKEALATEIDAKIKAAVEPIEQRIQVGADPIDKDPTAGFKTLSNFGLHVYKANRGLVSEELKKWETKAAGTPSQNITDNEAGAYLIPPEWSSQLLKPITQEDLVFSRTRKIPVQGNTIEMPYVNGYDESSKKVYGNVISTWMDEEDAHTPSNMKFGKLRLTLNKLGLMAFVTDEMISDSPASMEVILRDAFRDALTFELNDALIRGTGAGRPQGILNASALVTVSKETDQQAGTILFENIVKMYTRINDRSNAVWMVNPVCLPELVKMSLSFGTAGTAVWLPANGIAGRPFDTLMGLPVVYNKHCSNLSSVGDIILVDWSQYYVALKAGPEANGVYSSSIHLKFDYDQTAYKFLFRISGQSSWKTAVTPPQATANTISPFVTLEAR